MKVKVIENIGEDSLKCFGGVGTIHTVSDNFHFKDLTDYIWESYTGDFCSLETLNRYFSKLAYYSTIFELVD